MSVGLLDGTIIVQDSTRTLAEAVMTLQNEVEEAWENLVGHLTGPSGDILDTYATLGECNLEDCDIQHCSCLHFFITPR